jgi:LysM repeat protein
MTINLNKQNVTKEALLKYITDYDIYKRYILNDDVIVGKNIHSPFRNETNPSFGFFIGESGEICFHDFTLRLKGDCIKFVMILFDLTYYEALSKIAIDFDMGDDFYIKNIEEFKEAEKTPLLIILDDIRSLHNIGSVFRTSDAFLIEKIYLCGITAIPPNKEIHKTALGSTDTVAWEYVENTMDLIETLKSEKVVIASIEQAENAVMRSIQYQVRPGDSLARIASRFNVTITDIEKWNQISRSKHLQPGQRLKLYIDVTRISSQS